MFAVVVVGAGRIGASIAKLLYGSGDYDVTVADRDAATLERVVSAIPVRTIQMDAESGISQLTLELKRMAARSRTAVISCCSFDVNPLIAAAALNAGSSYFDLTEDVESTRRVRELAANAAEGQVFMPQCGLAPGFAGILAASMMKRFERVDSIRVRVGSLPEYPSNALMYNLMWSTAGVINEYCKPCEVIQRGARREAPALDGLEQFSIDGVAYEAFHTSGGLATLCETLDGKVNDLNYKTIRYPGHHYLMDFLVNGLKLGDTEESRKQLGTILERAVPTTHQDIVLIVCSASGWRDGIYTQETDVRKIYHQMIHADHWSAIQVTTASAACVAVDMFNEGTLPVQRGFVRQEEVGLKEFLANRFGKYYAGASVSDGHTGVAMA